MRLHRFYINEDLAVGKEFITDVSQHLHQWLSVFRYASGDRVILFNGSGSEFEAEFTELHKKKAILNILSAKASVMPSKGVHIYVAAIKKDLFELVVEKATELGVSSITPIITERTQDKNLNMDRLMRVAIEASEQSGRGDVPHINKAVSLENALNDASRYTIFLAQMGGQDSIKITSDTSRALFIGPEGGWGEKDLALFTNHPVETVSLGETVLRAETAAIVGSFMLLK